MVMRDCSKEVGWGGGKAIICDFGEEGVHGIKHLSYKRFSAGHEELTSP